MKLSETHRISRRTLLIPFMLFIHTFVFGQSASLNSSSGIANQTSCSTEFTPSESIQYYLLKVDVYQFNENDVLVQNGMKLDSIDEYSCNGWEKERYKWTLEYNTNKLIKKERVYFGRSYVDSLGIVETWNYNEREQLINYQKLRKVNISNYHDTLIIENEAFYTYYGHSIIEKTERSLDDYRISYDYPITYDDVVYDLIYDQTHELFKYNGQGQLIEYSYRKEYYGGEWVDEGVSKYTYDNFGRLIYRLYNHNYLENYNYTFTDSSKTITTRYYVFPDGVYPFDSIRGWNVMENYHYILDRFGRDSIYWCDGNEFNFSGYYSSYYKSRSSIAYDQENRLSRVSIYFSDLNDSLKWNEQGHLDFEYDEENQLKKYTQTYFDQRWNRWEVQKSRDYYYSEVKSAEFFPESESGATNEDFCIYPNPVFDYLNISGLSSSQAQYQIYDLYGRQIMKGNLTNNTVDVSGLERGTYLLKIINDNSINVQRFMKK